MLFSVYIYLNRVISDQPFDLSKIAMQGVVVVSGNDQQFKDIYFWSKLFINALESDSMSSL